MEANKKRNDKSVNILIGAIILIVLWLFGSCMKPKIDHEDGKCDICSDPSTYQGKNEEYCKKHFEDAVEWYVKHND